MLQIIGWLGCAYMFVKAFELFSAAKARGDGADKWDAAATIGGAIAILSAVVFFFMLNAQVDSAPY